MNDPIIAVAAIAYGLVEIVKYMLKSKDNHKRLGRTHEKLTMMDEHLKRVEGHLERDRQSKTEFWVLLKEIALNQRRTSEILDKIVDKMNK